MKCKICDRSIEGYNPDFHHLKIDDSCEVDICPDCTDKIIKHQGTIIAKLFPTKMMKKRYGENRRT